MKGMIVKMSNNECNQNNQQKQIKSKSSVGSTLLIIFLIVVIMVTSSIGLYAWAKYTSSISGNATAQVAKWSFKLVDGVTETSDVIEFAFTRTDGYEHVAEGRLAPGTFGKFEIGIDAKGTETLLEYIIDVERVWFTQNPNRLGYQTQAEFWASTSTNLDDLVYDWLSQWEGVPGDALAERQEAARRFYTYIYQHKDDDPSTYSWISGNFYTSDAQMLNNVMCMYFYLEGYTPDPGPGPGPTPGTSKKMPLWMYLKRFPF